MLFLAHLPPLYYCSYFSIFVMQGPYLKTRVKKLLVKYFQRLARLLSGQMHLLPSLTA